MKRIEKIRSIPRLVCAVFAALALSAAAGLLTGAAVAKTVIKLGVGTTQAEESLNRSITALKTYAETRSNGELEIRLFWNTLGGSLQLSEQVRDGTLEMALTDDSVMANFHKPMMALQVPYLFPSSAVAWEFMREPALWNLVEGMRTESGIRTLAFSENGFRNITNNVRPILTPADMAGIKMRTMQSPVYIEMMKSMGAAATPIPAPELFMSLRQGVVDGQENSPVAILDYKLPEVQKFMSLNEHTYGFHLIIVNDKFFESLPEDQRNILTEAAQLHSQTANSWRANASIEALSKLKEQGMDVHITTPAEKQAFREATQKPVIDYITAQAGVEAVQAVMTGADAAAKRVYGAP
jgi:tripartite ATP-independent transporter DctP family solute receptor